MGLVILELPKPTAPKFTHKEAELLPAGEPVVSGVLARVGRLEDNAGMQLFCCGKYCLKLDIT